MTSSWVIDMVLVLVLRTQRFGLGERRGRLVKTVRAAGRALGLALELAPAGVEQVREVLRSRDDLRDEALRRREERHQHRRADLVLAGHARQRVDPRSVEQLALVVAAPDLELGL